MPGQHQVEHDRVVSVDARHPERVLALGGDVGGDPLLPQALADQAGHLGLVLDDQNAHLGSPRLSREDERRMKSRLAPAVLKPGGPGEQHESPGTIKPLARRSCMRELSANKRQMKPPHALTPHTGRPRRLATRYPQSSPRVAPPSKSRVKRTPVAPLALTQKGAPTWTTASPSNFARRDSRRCARDERGEAWEAKSIDAGEFREKQRDQWNGAAAGWNEWSS